MFGSNYRLPFGFGDYFGLSIVGVIRPWLPIINPNPYFDPMPLIPTNFLLNPSNTYPCTFTLGMKTIEPTNQLLLPFMRESMKSHMLPALSKNLDFELICAEVQDRSMIVFIDPVKFRIVFRNLFSNAIKFSPTNGRIEVT